MNINLDGVHTLSIVGEAESYTTNIHRVSTRGCLFGNPGDICHACTALAEWHESGMMGVALCHKHTEDFLLNTALSGAHLEYKRE